MGAVTEVAVSPVTGKPYPTPKLKRELSLVAERRAQAVTQMFDLDSDKDAFIFLHIVLAQCGLPYSDPGPMCGMYTRDNGKFGLVVNRGTLQNPYTREFELQGYPYGSRPRLLMLYLCTEAIRRKSQDIFLGETLNEFMRLGLNIQPTGGGTGSIEPMKEQMMRLFAAHMRFFFTIEEKNDMMRHTTVNAVPFLQQFDIFFPKGPFIVGRTGRWNGSVTIADSIYERLKDGCMPLKIEAVIELQQSPVALDVYTWLAYRNFTWKRAPFSTLISWKKLHEQFGAGYRLERSFRMKFTPLLGKVKLAYPEARFEIGEQGVTLHKSPSPVQRKYIVCP